MSPDAPNPPPPVPARSPRLLSRLMLAVTLLLGLYIGWQESPREVGRWYLAAAVEHRLNAEYFRLSGRGEEADLEQRNADAALAQAIAWYPDGGEIYLERAKWREEQSQYQAALEDCEEALRLGVSQIAVAPLKASLLVHLGQPAEAVKEAERIHAHYRRTWSPYDDAVGLNARAYFRSLAKVNLPEALQDIDAALQQIPAKSHDAGILDTRGWVLFQMGQYEEAVTVFAKAVPRADAEVASRRAARPSMRVLDVREFSVANHQQLQSMAVIYYHASRVLEKLDRWKEAKELRAKAKDLLGREPDESVF